MLRIARARLRQARLGKQVQVLEADGGRIGATVPASVRSQIRSLTCCNYANEMFGRGQREAIKWFRELSKLFPGRPLLNADYYGRLGKKHRQLHRETLLHDYAQLILGQGVPPVTAVEWDSVYSKAGCRLVHVINDTSTTRFIHIIAMES